MDDKLKVTTKKLRKVKIAPVIEHHTELNRDEMISKIAYKLFEERNCEPGYAESDWLEAEARVDRLILGH